MLKIKMLLCCALDVKVHVMKVDKNQKQICVPGEPR